MAVFLAIITHHLLTGLLAFRRLKGLPKMSVAFSIDTLYHLYTPRHKRKDKIYPFVQQLCLPRTLRDSIAQAYHDNNSHIGFDKLYESIRYKYFWPRMYADLFEYVNSCRACQQTKRPIHNKKAPLKSLPVEDVFSRFRLDY